MNIEAKLRARGLSLPPPHAFPNANRIGCIQVGSLLFVSGHPPAALPGIVLRGKVTGEVSEQDAARAAEAAALNILATIKASLGTLDRVRRVAKLLGMVNSSPGFERQFAVIDGASNLFLALWGETFGRHARSAVGMAELPRGIPVEIEGIFEIQS